jgi:hypothetical protein
MNALKTLEEKCVSTSEMVELYTLTIVFAILLSKLSSSDDTVFPENQKLNRQSISGSSAGKMFTGEPWEILL